MSFSDYMTTLFMPALLQTVYMLFVPTISQFTMFWDW